jgi:Zinc carboxypeptidase
MKNILIGVLVVALIGLVVFVVMRGDSTIVINEPTDENTQVETPTATPPATNETPEPPATNDTNEPVTIIGTSVNERDIKAFHYGTGDNEVLFVGGMHGGYSWNTTAVAEELINYLNDNPTAVPKGVKVTIIPALNPDGLMKVAGAIEDIIPAEIPKGAGATIPGRFNGNNVDLNRNFDCAWQTSGTWQNRTVSGGSAAFSEPESQALRDYVEDAKPTAVVVWYSAAGGVYASNCYNGVLPETTTLTNLYAQASGYPAYEKFDYYEITGDAVNWLAKIGVPAISVLLTTHTDIEWDKNKKGIEAILNHYAE